MKELIEFKVAVSGERLFLDPKHVVSVHLHAGHVYITTVNDSEGWGVEEPLETALHKLHSIT